MIGYGVHGRRLSDLVRGRFSGGLPFCVQRCEMIAARRGSSSDFSSHHTVRGPAKDAWVCSNSLPAVQGCTSRRRPSCAHTRTLSVVQERYSAGSPAALRMHYGFSCAVGFGKPVRSRTLHGPSVYCWRLRFTTDTQALNVAAPRPTCGTGPLDIALAEAECCATDHASASSSTLAT